MTRREKGLFIGSFFLFFLLIGSRIFFEGQFYCNDQFGFGLFPITGWFFGVEVLFLVALLYLSAKTAYFSERCIFSILFVAGFSNLCERIIFGCVLDYLKIPFVGSFINLADIIITSLLGYLMIDILMKGFKK